MNRLALDRRQGSVGLEILEQVPNVDAIVVPVGGAGLIAGVALAVKTQKPDVQVIGVEPTNYPVRIFSLLHASASWFHNE